MAKWCDLHVNRQLWACGNGNEPRQWHYYTAHSADGNDDKNVKSYGRVLPTQLHAALSLLANDSAAFKRKLHCRWIKDFHEQHAAWVSKTGSCMPLSHCQSFGGFVPSHLNPEFWKTIRRHFLWSHTFVWVWESRMHCIFSTRTNVTQTTTCHNCNSCSNSLKKVSTWLKIAETTNQCWSLCAKRLD